MCGVIAIHPRDPIATVAATSRNGMTMEINPALIFHAQSWLG